MASLGEKLMVERETRGISIEEASKATRINSQYLRGLEKDDYACFPAAVYLKGFLRTYASFLGLDADRIIAEYGPVGDAIPKRQAIKMDEGEPDGGRTLFLIAGGLIILLVGTLVLTKSQSEKPAVKSAVMKPSAATKSAEPRKTASPATAPTMPAKPAVAEKTETATVAPAKPAETKPEAVAGQEQAPATEPATADVQSPAEPIEKTAPAASESAAAKETEEPAETYRYYLRISAGQEDVWILVVIDGSEVKDMFVRAGKSIILKGNESFVFTTGNLGNLTLAVNDEMIIPPATPQGVLRNWKVPLP